MNVIVDANVVFSGILNTKGKIGDLLINSFGLINFIAPDFLRTEIRKHHNKLSKISKLSVNDILEAEFLVCKDITFISEEQVLSAAWEAAVDLVKNIDEKDAPYIAFSKHFNRKIWSGDKQLIRGLKRKGFDKFVSTEELFMIRERQKKRKQKK